MKTTIIFLFAIFTILINVYPFKLSAQTVTQEWVARYNGPGNGSDEARATVVDVAGNVYVTGYNIGIGTGNDYVTIKYNSNGDSLWVARYNGPGNGDDYPNSIAIDVSGNVYVTGQSFGNGTNRDYATIKYNSFGVQQWVARYNGSGNNLDQAISIVVDVSGNVYVTGNSWDTVAGPDYATIKYNSSGVQQWVKRYSGRNGFGYDLATRIAVDGGGNVYVTGSSDGTGTSRDYATIKYNSIGDSLWVVRYNGSGNGDESANSIAVDGAGNVYISGSSEGLGTGRDYATIKYNSSGVEQWVRRYNGPGNGTDWATSLAIDALGSVYVTGHSWGNGTGNDYATIKYNSAGVQQWVRRYNGSGNGEDWATSLAIDAERNVYVTGWSDSIGVGRDFTTVKYNTNGVEQWVARYNGPANWTDQAYSISLDGSGNVYVTGSSHGIGTGFDFATIKYSQETPKRRPVFIVPGVGATYAANIQNDFGWMLKRGIHPDSIQIDPLGKVYHDLIITLENNGYVKGKDLFVVNYDWRLQPGPADNNIDGHISGLTAQGISDEQYVYAVDYLGWYMKKAADKWRQDHNEELDSVDIISHSTGGLVARTYIQSNAYGGVYNTMNDYKLPKVKNLMMLGVPNRGASKPWNVLQDNWSGDLAYRFVLSKLINRAYQKVLKGYTIIGGDYNINKASILDINGNPDKKKFIYKYVPTLRYLLSTYPFLDFGNGLETINNDPEIRNTILLDLNNGADINAANDPNKFANSCKVSILYVSSKETGEYSKYREDFEFKAIHSFTDFIPRDALPGEGWYQDIVLTNNGDGTVPTISSAGQFLSDTRTDVYQFTNSDHTAMVSKPEVQQTVLEILGIAVNTSTISTGNGADARTILSVISDPVEVVITDGLGRRLGYTEGLGALEEIPNSVWVGNTEGIGYVFGDVVEPLNVQLTGLGEDYYVMLSFEDSTDNKGGVVLEGFLEEGEQVTYEVTIEQLKNIDAGITSIVSPKAGQVLDKSGSVVSAYVKNFGSDTIANCNLFYSYNGVTKGPVKIPENLAPNDSILVSFPDVYRLKSQEDVIDHELKIFIGDLNDTNESNNSAILQVSLVKPVSVYPYLESFNCNPPYSTSGNPDIWNFEEGFNPSGVPGDTMMKAEFYSNVSGESILRTPLIDLSLLSNPVLSFYMSYTSSLLLNDDGLEVMVSTNGGITFNAPLYSKSFLSQPSLATVSPQSDEFAPSNTNQWRYLMFDLTPYAGQEIVIGFKGVSAGGNNLWIDNLKIAETNNVELILVNGTGTYGNIISSQAQVNITGFNLLRSGRSNTFISPDASEGELVISRVDDFPANQNVNTNTLATTFSGAIFTPDVISDKYWDVSYSGDDYNSLATYDFIIDISSQLGIVDADRIYVLKRNNDNDSWECLSTVTEYEAGLPVKIIATGLNGFGQFAFGTDDGTLPVDLVEFNANVDKNNVTLNWTTAWEENNMRFDVQRRIAEADASWATVGSVTGSGTTQEQKSYSYLDRNLVTGMYEYRLVQVDFDGNSTADHTLSSQIEIGVPNEFALSQNYPNPFNPTTMIDFQIPVEGLTKLVVFDMSGREVATLVNDVLTPGYYTYTFNGANFASGVYFYRLVSSNSVITKRAVLVK